jgi:hypothetical protein
VLSCDPHVDVSTSPVSSQSLTHVHVPHCHFLPQAYGDLFGRIITREQSIDKLTAVWLLPIVLPIVAAGVGGNLCTVIPQAAISPTLIVSYVCWGIGVPFAMSILILYIHRLTIYKVSATRLSSPSNKISYRRANSA